MAGPQKRRGSLVSRAQGFRLGTAAAVLVVGGATFYVLNDGEGWLRKYPRALPKPSKADQAIFATYGGSPTCRSCHQDAYRLWEGSHHAMAERPIDPAIDSVAFQSHFKIRHGSSRDYVRTRRGKFEIVTTGPDGRQQAFVPERVLAVNPLRQFLVPFPRGRYQVTELAYDPNHPDWFNVYGDEDRRAGEWGHWTGRGMTWNVMCAGCHNTRVRKNYEPATDTYRTTLAERGVGCEACHGPMADHNAWQALHPNQTGDPTVRKIPREEMFHVCGSCHSRRSDLTGDFRPGENYFDHYSLSIPDETDLFYPDGQIRDEDFELTAFLGSRMHASNVRCIDCHEPHLGKVRIVGNNLCMVCHAAPAPPAPKIDPATHSHHKPGQRGDFCTDCHMPQTVYMQRHPRHDHGFTIPDPVLTREFGIPNACTRCHDDRDVEWSLEAVEKWYGDRMNRPSRDRARILARAKQGDDQVVDSLVALLQTETNGFWRAVSAGMLRRWSQQPKVASALLAATADDNSLVRSMSLRALEPLAAAREPAVEAAFRKRLDDPIRGVRLDAAWGLHRWLDTNSAAGRDLAHYLAHNSDQPSGLLQLGVFHLDRGQVAEALRQFQRAIAWDTNSAPLYDALAVALSMSEKPGQAVEALRRACDLAPQNAEYRYKLGLALNELGRLGEARAALEQAVALDPQFARAWYNLGLAYHATGQTENAIQSLLRAEAADPRAPQFPYARATILARAGRVAEARAAASRALQLQPDFREAAELLEALSR